MYLTDEQFEERFKPQLNHFHNDENQPWNGWMYETYGEEDEYIRKFAQENPNRVWTIVTDDYDELCIGNGWHYVNRFGYIICEVPFDDTDDFSVYDIDIIKKYQRREKREQKKAKA